MRSSCKAFSPLVISGGGSSPWRLLPSFGSLGLCLLSMDLQHINCFDSFLLFKWRSPALGSPVRPCLTRFAMVCLLFISERLVFAASPPVLWMYTCLCACGRTAHFPVTANFPVPFISLVSNFTALQASSIMVGTHFVQLQSFFCTPLHVSNSWPALKKTFLYALGKPIQSAIAKGMLCSHRCSLGDF